MRKPVAEIQEVAARLFRQNGAAIRILARGAGVGRVCAREDGNVRGLELGDAVVRDRDVEMRTQRKGPGQVGYVTAIEIGREM